MNSLDKIIQKKLKVYYTLKEVSEIVGMHYNSCKNRVKYLKKNKYKNTSKLIYMEGKYYRIHESVLADFLPLKPDKRRKNVMSKYESFTTINPKEKYYSREIFDDFIKEIQIKLPKISLECAVEDNYYEKGKNMHIHILSDVKSFYKEIAYLIEMFFGEVKVREESPHNIFSVLKYIKKANINY